LPPRLLYDTARYQDKQLFEFFKKVNPEASLLSMITVILGEIGLFSNYEIPQQARFFHLCAAAGRLDIFQEAESRKLRYNGHFTITAAIGSGATEILKFVDARHPIRQPILLEGLPSLAADFGRLEILKYLFQIPEFRILGNLRVEQGAGAGGHVHVLDWMWDSGIPINFEKVCIGAIKGQTNTFNKDNIQALKWVRKKKGTWQLSSEFVTLASKRRDHKGTYFCYFCVPCQCDNVSSVQPPKRSSRLHWCSL
jgi:hypothetical protein